jgi:hypothetical protein
VTDDRARSFLAAIFSAGPPSQHGSLPNKCRSYTSERDFGSIISRVLFLPLEEDVFSLLSATTQAPVFLPPQIYTAPPVYSRLYASNPPPVTLRLFEVPLVKIYARTRENLYMSSFRKQTEQNQTRKSGADLSRPSG